MHFRTKATSETTLFRGDWGLSSTISIYRVAIKHCLIPYVKDCRDNAWQISPGILREMYVFAALHFLFCTTTL